MSRSSFKLTIDATEGPRPRSLYSYLRRPSKLIIGSQLSLALSQVKKLRKKFIDIPRIIYLRAFRVLVYQIVENEYRRNVTWNLCQLRLLRLIILICIRAVTKYIPEGSLRNNTVWCL